MDTLRAARYPFLKDASHFIEANDIDIAELMTSPDWSDARRRGMERIIGSLKNHEIPDVPLAGAEYRRLEECLSYPYARMIVSCIDDRMLTKRYALAEAERLNRLLHDDRDAIPKVLPEGVKLLETKIQPVAFGLMKVNAGFAIDDSIETIGTDLENALTSIPGIQNVECVSSTNY